GGGAGVLHTLGHHVEVEVAAEIHGRPDNRRQVRVDGHVTHEGAVDLDLVDGEALEVGQRRVARAEVVDGEPHAHLPQAVDDGDRALRLVHHGRLGDLEREGVAG